MHIPSFSVAKKTPLYSTSGSDSPSSDENESDTTESSSEDDTNHPEQHAQTCITERPTESPHDPTPAKSPLRRAHSVAGDSPQPHASPPQLVRGGSLAEDILRVKEDAKMRAQQKSDAELGIVSTLTPRLRTLSWDKRSQSLRMSCPPEVQNGRSKIPFVPLPPTPGSPPPPLDAKLPPSSPSGRDLQVPTSPPPSPPSQETAVTPLRPVNSAVPAPGLVAQLYNMNIESLRKDRKGFSESSKEGKLLVKSGRKYNRRARLSISPEDRPDGVAPKANGRNWLLLWMG